MRLKVVSARAISALLTLVMVAPPAAWADSTVRCESSNYRYKHCSASTNGRVTLERQLSNTRCREDDNWGYDRHGIWVDHGCGAEFRVGNGGSSHDKALAAGAAVAGIAVLAALASQKSSSNSGNQSADVAPWAVGSFRGYDADERSNVEITVLPGGSVSGNAGSNEFTGRLRGDQLEAGRQNFRIERSGNGFLATDIRNSAHRVQFQRSGSGY